jgi:hypothetical protein
MHAFRARLRRDKQLRYLKCKAYEGQAVYGSVTDLRYIFTYMHISQVGCMLIIH